MGELQEANALAKKEATAAGKAAAVAKKNVKANAAVDENARDNACGASVDPLVPQELADAIEAIAAAEGTSEEDSVRTDSSTKDSCDQGSNDDHFGEGEMEE